MGFNINLFTYLSSIQFGGSNFAKQTHSTELTIYRFTQASWSCSCINAFEICQLRSRTDRPARYTVSSLYHIYLLMYVLGLELVYYLEKKYNKRTMSHNNASVLSQFVQRRLNAEDVVSSARHCIAIPIRYFCDTYYVVTW